MPVIKMNVPCIVVNVMGFDAFGQPRMSPKRPSKCAVLKLELISQASTIRADSASSKGHADDEMANLHVLMAKNEHITIDDLIEVNGQLFKVNGYRPRYDVLGKIDHIEVKGKIKA